MKLKTGMILTAGQMKRANRNTIWVLSYASKGQSHFLGSYPTAMEAEQAAEEEFAHLHRTLDVIGYDARKLDPALVG